MKQIYILFIITMLSIIFAFCSGSSDTAHNRNDTGEPDGKKIYKTYCKLCHGAKGGLGINGAANLKKSEMELAERIAIITNGKTTMTPFKGTLTEKQIEAVAEYSMTLVKD